jgi:tetratricopeptide (TPR) repeat protein
MVEETAPRLCDKAKAAFRNQGQRLPRHSRDEQSTKKKGRCVMTQQNPQTEGNEPQPAGITLTGGAAIMAPVSAFQGALPNNALVLIPLGANGQPLEKQIAEGPLALKMDDVWKLLGFNGPAVQVQDEQGRPIAIGLEDLLGGLEKQWNERPQEAMLGRIFAQELMKYNRFEKAETVLSRLVASGLDGEDWLGLGIAQLQQEKFDKAIATLRGAQNLMKENPYPSLHLAKAFAGKQEKANEREAVEKAIQIAPNAVDAWVYLYTLVKSESDEAGAIAAVEKLAGEGANNKAAAPFIALQSFFAENEETRPKAIEFAKRGVEKAPADPLALLCLSALYGQSNQIDDLIKLLAPAEALMQKDVRLANNYLQALVHKQDMDKIKVLLNKLATSPNAEVKQYAIERSRELAQAMRPS